MKYDYKALYEKNAAFYNERPVAKKLLLITNKALTYFFFLAYVALLVVAVVKEYSPEAMIKILGAPLLCLLVVTVLRLAIDRPRPYSESGKGITPLSPKKGDGRESFPSRHLACAFVIATTFAPYSLACGIIFGVLGIALGYVRFSGGWHYPSDLFAGAVLGVVCGITPLFF